MMDYTIICLNLSVYFLETKIATISFAELVCHATEDSILTIAINTLNVLFKAYPTLALQTVAVCQTQLHLLPFNKVL